LRASIVAEATKFSMPRPGALLFDPQPGAGQLGPRHRQSPRRLFWRYNYNDQRAARDGDWKYLKILDNTFLFDVARDPMERANLKERHRDVYKRLPVEWNEWNSSMLPLDPQSFTGGFTGAQLADHFGASRQTAILAWRRPRRHQPYSVPACGRMVSAARSTSVPLRRVRWRSMGALAWPARPARMFC
jgi:hypothetical protein